VTRPLTAMLHYTAPPTIGGVESVIQAHAGAFLRAGYPVAVVAGQGEGEALPPGARLIRIPEIDSRHPRVVEMSGQLKKGRVPDDFEAFSQGLARILKDSLGAFDNLIAHNVLSKDFNLPLTAALFDLLQAGDLPHLIAWGHDFSWSSTSSRVRMHDGYPWDLLRTYHPEVTYVVVSERRRQELAGLLGCPQDRIRVVYNGVDARSLLSLSEQGWDLAERLELLAADLVLLMPVRVTAAKNVELALRVVAALKAHLPCVRLVLTGPPDPHDPGSRAYFRSLQEMRRKLGVEAEMRFVFEMGGDAGQGLIVGTEVVADLYRASDLMFMPSLREGFGMPVLEAAMAGLPVVCTAVPAAVEIGREEAIFFDPADDPAGIAARILAWAESSPVHRLRRRVRQTLTWETIFKRQIQPLLGPARRGEES
jgi:mannosylglucosylglycerate synthase